VRTEKRFKTQFKTKMEKAPGQKEAGERRLLNEQFVGVHRKTGRLGGI